jgi:hypothetical protein
MDTFFTIGAAYQWPTKATGEKINPVAVKLFCISYRQAEAEPLGVGAW